MNTVTHTIVVLHLPRSVADFMGTSKHVVQEMSNNPQYFPSPPTPYATVLTNLGALDAAETLARTGAKGTAQARDLRLRASTNDLHGLRSYAQIVVDSNPPELSSAIIACSGMSERQATGFSKPHLAVSMGPSPGLVLVRAKAAGRRAAYEWEFSADGGKSWVTLSVTGVADTSVPGLVAGTTYLFRFRSTVRKTTSDWSQVVSFMVH